MKENIKENRIWEIDFIRGIAIILMVIFHVVFDLREMYNFPVYYSSGIFYYVGKASAILFMLIAGISSSFSRNNVKRGFKIFCIALGITVVTYLFDPNLTIKFGILHFFGISMMMYPLFKPINKYLLLVLGTLVIAVGIYFSKINMPFDYLFFLGIRSESFTSGDYYPLFPWFGVYLYGIALGRILYKDKKSVFSFKVNGNLISLIGRHSLLIYVVHQPIIILVLNLIMK